MGGGGQLMRMAGAASVQTGSCPLRSIMAASDQFKLSLTLTSHVKQLQEEL